MRGHIQKRGNSYRIGISMGLDHETGKYKYSWSTVRGTKKDAEKRLNVLLSQIDNGIFVKPGKETLAGYLESWLTEYCRANLAPRTAEVYEYMVRKYIAPALGHTPLTQLKPEHLQRFYAERLASGLGNRTVQYCHVTLHKALGSAVKLGMIVRNPADGVERPKVARHEMHVMNEADLHKFLDVAKDTPYFALFFLSLFTGMRRSEILALRWSDVDLMLNQVSVSRTIHRLESGEVLFRQPKTAKSRRTIALSPSASIMLRQERENQMAIKDALGEKLQENDLIFCHIDGKPLLPMTITHAWKHIAHKAGLDGIRLHDARHTHASLMLKAGIHPKIVQERLGHASIQITLDTYSHVAPGLQEAAAARFDEVVMQKVAIKARQ